MGSRGVQSLYVDFVVLLLAGGGVPFVVAVSLWPWALGLGGAQTS